jgi:hypothetical protein
VPPAGVTMAGCPARWSSTSPDLIAAATVDSAGVEDDAQWRTMLTGDASLSRQLRWQRRLFKPLPSNPLCKLCYAPQGGITGQREQKLDFTALADAVNLTQRRSSVAEGGEILFGEGAVRAADLDTAFLAPHVLELRGIGHRVIAWSERHAVTSAT